MERTVPQTVSNEIDLYLRTYYSLLRTTGTIAIETLIEAHESMSSALHPEAASPSLDASALIYASLRLPPELVKTKTVVLGQQTSVFARYGLDVEAWQLTAAKARRRRAYFDGKDILALYISSRSDIDDIIPALTAFQIEWNKIHFALASSKLTPDDDLEVAAEGLGTTPGALDRLARAWGRSLPDVLRAIGTGPKKLGLRLLAGSLIDYRRAMIAWWGNIDKHAVDMDFAAQRIYFVSSNTHSLANLWTGHALRNTDDLLDMLVDLSDEQLQADYEAIVEGEQPVVPANFFYYLLKKYQERHGNAAQKQDEAEVGMVCVPSAHAFDLEAQIVPLNQVRPDWVDPRIVVDGMDALATSDAIILNIDYPLGMAAYEVLTHIAEHVHWVMGVYIMGKAATLNGRVGDVMIPITVHDEHTANTYLFRNGFSAGDVAPYLEYGNVLDNQKSVTVRGTFLQNAEYMGVFYREGFTDIEMEAGPYLSAIYELIRPKRHPQNEIVSLYGTPLEIGIIHYASDTPMTKGVNLGAGSLSYRGMAPTYAASVAILRRIIEREIEFLRDGSYDREA
ncbi:MAG: hypothetical protein GYB64_03375 [Chloroflexi bacterium]|nr:hypothetical protein [Chloroflexota bacterium]